MNESTDPHSYLSIHMQEIEHPSGIGIINAGLDGIKFLYRCYETLGQQGIINLHQMNFEINGVLFEKENISFMDAYAVIFNSIQSAICCHWIAIDEALNEVFGDKTTLGNSTYIDDFRTVIYMFRCAFAHGIAQPKWNISKEKYRRNICLTIPEKLRLNNLKEFAFNFISCHNLPLRNEDYGNLPGIVMLSKMACELIKPAND